MPRLTSARLSSVDPRRPGRVIRALADPIVPRRLFELRSAGAAQLEVVGELGGVLGGVAL